MAVSDHLRPGLTDRTRVRIMTVDPSTRRIEGMLKDGSMIQVAVWDVPNAFRWPIETEIWIVRRDNGVWMLDRRVQQGEVVGSGPTIQTQPEPAPIENMTAGEMKLDSATIIDANGQAIIAALAHDAASVAIARAKLGITSGVTTVTWGGGSVATATGIAHQLSHLPSSVQVTMQAAGRAFVLAAHAGNFTTTTFDVQAAQIGGTPTPGQQFPAMWVAYL